MRLHRFYTTEQIGEGKNITIDSAELVNQVRRVFRLGIGDSIIIFNGTGFDYECKIDGFEKSTKISTESIIKLTVATSRRSAFSPGRDASEGKSSWREIILCAAVVKKDTFEWIVEKATELGVSRVVPVMAERSEKKSLNEERLRKIAVEASEQSGRGDVPDISGIAPLPDVLDEMVDKATVDSTHFSQLKCVVFHTEGESFKASECVGAGPLAVFIGPEGGWSPAELEMFHAKKIPLRCLGPQVLRAETAVVAALSVVVFAK